MFSPPEELLEESIGSLITDAIIVIPTFSDDSDYGLAHIVAAISSMVKEIYRKSEWIKKAGWSQHVLEVFGEAVQNAAKHGNKQDRSKKITLGIWFGEFSLLFAIKDEGSFMSDPENKEKIESRILLPYHDNGCGMPSIYKADRIHVSTEENTLYLVVNFVRFV